MIDSVRIENFKCFESVDASGLGQVNVLVGDNRSGKTAFLEALYVASGNTPENHLKAQAWRGLHGERLSLSQAEFKKGAPWRDLFYRYDLQRDITVSLHGQSTRVRSILIARRERTEISVPLADSVGVDSPIVFIWTDESGKDWPCIPQFSEKALTFPASPPGIAGAMIPDRPVSSKEAADRFSELDIRGEAQSIAARLCHQFRDIQGLSVQTDVSAGALVYASITGMSVKIPLPLVSGGVNRWLYLLCTVESFPGGAVFVDEIEKGIYFQRLTGFWQTVVDSAAKSSTQVFASTHSGEALSALLPVVEKAESDFRLIRLSRDKEGRSTVRVIGGDDLAAALAERVELR